MKVLSSLHDLINFLLQIFEVGFEFDLQFIVIYYLLVPHKCLLVILRACCH